MLAPLLCFAFTIYRLHFSLSLYHQKSRKVLSLDVVFKLKMESGIESRESFKLFLMTFRTRFNQAQ